MASNVKRVVLAYSGGLDTSVILRWLQDTYNCEVITFTADIGQGEELGPAKKKAETMGIREIFVETPKVRWDEIGGLEEIKEILTKVVINPIKNNEFREKMPKGIMLYGPPGSGKTMLAKALANISGMNFISIKGPELVSKYLGESEEKIKDFFNKARQVSPSILFIDEIDSICRAGIESEKSNTHRIVSQLLLEMDGFKDLNNVIVLAATNKIEYIDKSLLRSGRFDLLLETINPHIDDILRICLLYTSPSPRDRQKSRMPASA